MVIRTITVFMATRRNVLQLAGINALAAFASADRLPNSTLDASRAKLTHEPFGDLRIYYDGPTDQLKAMTAGSLLLKAGMTPHPPHQHPEEEFMIVASGTGEIECAGKITQVGPGSVMYCAGQVVHGITNTGKVPLTFYWSKWLGKNA